jgi:rubrerythrin
MATEDRIQVVLNALADIQPCRQCGTAVRFGDYECPHCGADLEDALRDWARKLVEGICE